MGFMTENKRFKVYKVIGSFHEWSIEDTTNDKIVFGSIMHKYEADRLCECLNSLADENKQLHRAIIEDEKMIQSIYEELSKLRLIKQNLREIKYKWDWIMESVDYD